MRATSSSSSRAPGLAAASPRAPRLPAVAQVLQRRAPRATTAPAIPAAARSSSAPAPAANSRCPHRPRRPRRPLKPVASLDYVASAADEGVLGLPPRSELSPADITDVFGYPRDLTARYYLGRVLGAGSFGVVREAIGVDSGMRHAVKTIPKAPKRGPATPR